MRLSKYLITAGCGAVLAVGGAVLVPASAGASEGSAAPVVVMSGLNNPRQLSLVGDNQLLVAEAGKGGDTVIHSPEGDEYVGYTGAVDQITNPQTASGLSPNRIVTGLMSGAGSPDGSFAVGSDGVSSSAPLGPIYIQETYAPPDVLPTPPGGQQDGRLLRARRDTGSFVPVANIAGYEKANDPDGHGFDSDPYAVLDLGNNVQLVADAAANDVLKVDHGSISVFRVFPNVTGGACAQQYDPSPEFPGCNFVPTSLAKDSAGNIYVGGLGSEVKHQGRVVELSPSGSIMHTWYGFTSVTGVAVANDGTLYVSQLEAHEANPPFPQLRGVVTQIKAGNVRTNMDVPFPAGIAVDSMNNVYVSAWSVSSESGLAGPGTDGQVWRLQF